MGRLAGSGRGRVRWVDEGGAAGSAVAGIICRAVARAVAYLLLILLRRLPLRSVRESKSTSRKRDDTEIIIL